MKYKANNFTRESVNDFKVFVKDNRFIRKILNKITIAGLILYLIIAIGSVVLDINYNASIITMFIISIVIAYFILRQGAYIRLIRHFKRLNNNFLEINEEIIEFICKNQITKLNRSDIKAIYSLKNTFFIITEGYCRNEKKKKVYFVSAIPKSIFNSDEDYNLFFNSLDKSKIKQLS